MRLAANRCHVRHGSSPISNRYTGLVQRERGRGKRPQQYVGQLTLLVDFETGFPVVVLRDLGRRRDLCTQSVWPAGQNLHEHWIVRKSPASLAL